jgi:hypothetical protein
VISLFQQFNGIRYRARATLREMELGDKSPKVQRTLTAICNSDAPENEVRAAKGNSSELRGYWTSGLAGGRRSGDYGWTLICLDRNAALHNANGMIRSLPVLMSN